jgi:hypothetical protein
MPTVPAYRGNEIHNAEANDFNVLSATSSLRECQRHKSVRVDVLAMGTATKFQ